MSSTSSSRSTPTTEQVAVYAGVGSTVATLERGEGSSLDADTEPEMYTIHGVAIGGNDITVGQSGIKKKWPPGELKKAAESLEGQELVRQHQNNEEGTIGTVTQATYRPGKGVLYEAEIAPHYDQVVKDIRAGILDVSPRIYHSHPDNLEEDDETGALIAENLRFDNLSIVADGASPSNTAIFGDSPVLSPGAGQAKAATASASAGAGDTTESIVTAVLSQGRPDADTVAATLEGAQFSQGDWVEWDTRNSTEIGKVTGTYHKGDDMPNFRGSRGYSPEEGEHLYGLRMYKQRDGTWHPIEGGVIGHYQESVRSHDEPENVSDSSVELASGIDVSDVETASELADPMIRRPTDGDKRLLIHTPVTHMDSSELNRIKTLIDDELGVMPDVQMTNEGIMFGPLPGTASGKHEHKHMHLDVMESAVDNLVGIEQKSTIFAGGVAGTATIQPCYVTSEEFSDDTQNEIARLLNFVAGVSGNVYYHNDMLMIDTGEKKLSHTALDVAEILVRRMGDANGIDVTANRFRIGSDKSSAEEMGESNTSSHSVAEDDWVQWYPESGPQEAHGKVERIDEPADQSEETKAVMTMYMQDDDGVWHPTDHTKKLPVSEVEGWGNYPSEDAISSEEMMSETYGMVRPGMMFFSRMNDSLLRVQDIAGDVATIMTVDGDSQWKERRHDVVEKVGEGSWRQVHPDSSLYRMMVRDSEMSYGSSDDSEEMMDGDGDMKMESHSGILHGGMMFFSQINDSLLRIKSVKDDMVKVASVDHDAEWNETRDDVIDKIADDDWKYVDPDSSLYQMSDARSRMSDSMSASGSYGSGHGMKLSMDKPTMPKSMSMKIRKSEPNHIQYGDGGHSETCPHCQNGGSCPQCDHNKDCPYCEHDMSMGMNEETPQWREGQLVQWQVEPDLFGKVVHVDHKRKIAMVAIHDKVGSRLKDTGFTISAGYSDLVEYNSTAESMAYGGGGDSEVPDKHIFDTKEDAMEKAKEMGLDDVHPMGDGKYMPGASHSDYKDAVESMSDYDSDTYDVPDYHYFEGKSEAMEKATEMGLEGIHPMGDFWMPGRSHHRYISAVEDDELALTTNDAQAVMEDVMNGHKFDNKEDAMEKAEDMGLDGVHKMDGKFMPGSSHDEYREALENDDEMSASLASEARKSDGSGDTDDEPEKSLSDSQETALKNKVEEHNEKHGDEDGKKVNFTMLRNVYKRGIGAYQDSHRPGMTPQQWSMARVNAFLYLVRNGNPENDAYTQDNDLLPEDHSKYNESGDEENAQAPFLDSVAELSKPFDVDVPVEFDGTEDGMLEEADLPTEGYKPHYLFGRDTKTDSSYPVVDEDGTLRRGNVNAAFNLRSTIERDEDYEMNMETFEKMLLNLNEEFDDPPIDPSNADEVDAEEMNRYTASMDELDDVYSEWDEHVNMTASELDEWADHECANEASLEPEEVRERNMNLLETNKSDWTEDEIADAKKTISFISRMGVEQNKPANPMGPTDECPSEWLISMLNWAKNPYDELPDEPKDPEETDEMSASSVDSGSVSDVNSDDNPEELDIKVATTGDASSVTGLRLTNNDGTTDGDEMNTVTSSRPHTVASLASGVSQDGEISQSASPELQSEQTSAFSMKELTYDTADEDTLEQMSEPVVVEQGELDELHEKASQSDVVEDELSELTERVESMSEAADILDNVSDDELSTLKESDDPTILESEEHAELESMVDEVAMVYAEELAETSPVLTAEELKSEFSPTTLREKFEESDTTMTGDINESEEPDPKGGAVESEELEQSSTEQEQEAQLEDARELVAEELRSAGWQRQAEKMADGDIPVEPYLDE